jgi:hypothetical protein
MPKHIYIEDDYVTYPKFNISLYTKERPFELVLFGDSLIDFPMYDFNLHDRLYNYIQDAIREERQKINYEDNHINHINPAYALRGQQFLLPANGYNNDTVDSTFDFNLRITFRSHGGDTVQMLIDRVDNDVLNGQYDGILIFWDSDISNDSPIKIDSSKFKKQFKEKVVYLFQRIQQKIPYIAFAFPEILGEGPVLKYPDFWFKETTIMNHYRQLCQEIGKQLQIPYMNIRKGFQELIPTYWILSFGYITTDGEHPNYFGTKIISKYFAEQFMRWYRHQ